MDDGLVLDGVEATGAVHQTSVQLWQGNIHYIFKSGLTVKISRCVYVNYTLVIRD